MLLSCLLEACPVISGYVQQDRSVMIQVWNDQEIGHGMVHTVLDIRYDGDGNCFSRKHH